ncbi:hypothetical protein ACFLV3_05835 [Chloroflexota bacterium]
MIKRVVIFALPEDADGDKFWEYHTKVHAPDVLKTVGWAIKKYTISRFKDVYIRTDNAFGKQRYFGLTEVWWESEEVLNKALEDIKNTKLPDGKSVTEDFWAQVPEGFGALVEEFVAKDFT